MKDEFIYPRKSLKSHTIDGLKNIDINVQNDLTDIIEGYYLDIMLDIRNGEIPFITLLNMIRKSINSSQTLQRILNCTLINTYKF